MSSPTREPSISSTNGPVSSLGQSSRVKPVIKDEDVPNCPICNKDFDAADIEVHVNRCIFLTTMNEPTSKCNTLKRRHNETAAVVSQRKKKAKPAHQTDGGMVGGAGVASKAMRMTFKSDSIDITDREPLSLHDKLMTPPKPAAAITTATAAAAAAAAATTNSTTAAAKSLPLAEQMRPKTITDYVGQTHILANGTILRTVLERNEVPSMILWGPPGCGKTTLAHIIANQCKGAATIRFVKVSATMVGINEVKTIVQQARNDQRFQRQTILFMDEIHRFNKLQQDTFLPHVESGVITLIGATTENPSFSLNAALLSRCRVLVLEKLSAADVLCILERSLRAFNAVRLAPGTDATAVQLDALDFDPRVLVDAAVLQWLADLCDGDARIGLNGLQLAMQARNGDDVADGGGSQLPRIRHVRLADIKEDIKRSHFLYDRNGDQHYDMISALHKSIRASDENASLYWCCRMMAGGEDPRYIGRRLVRAATEDVGLADPQALPVAMAALNAVQLIGMPEADCVLAQCAVYLARAPKDQQVYVAMKQCQADIEGCKGPQPVVPMHLRNAPTKLMKSLGCGQGYSRDMNCMPAGYEDRVYLE